MNNVAARARRLLPRGLKLGAMRHLFGLMPDGRKPGHSVAHNRMVLAARYLHGDGIEIGALGRPLLMPAGARVRYVDRMSASDLRRHYPHLTKRWRRRLPVIVDDGETLATISDASQDFVVANHVIEHFQNPIRFLHNACRVLKPGGILFMAIPDKEKTFDRDRPVTPFEHLVEDFENGAERSREAHYREFVRLAEGATGAESRCTESEFETRARALMEQNYSIHFHVWDREAMMAMILAAQARYDLPLVPDAMLATGDEVIFVLSRA